MSKVRSPNKGSATSVLPKRLLVLAIVAVLGGCSRVDVHAPQIRGIAYVRLDEVEPHHPLHAQLAQLEDAIAAIDLAAAAPRVPRSAAEIAAATKTLDAQLKAAQDRANAILTQKQQSYAQREAQAVNAALAAAGVHVSGPNAAAAISATSAQQMQAAASAASRDFVAYQQSVITQDNAAVSAIARQLQTQAGQKLRARAEVAQQHETDLSLRLAQEDSAARLAIRTRLSTLALDDATRSQLQSQLSALDKKEADQVNALRARDTADLTRYRAEVLRETDAAIKTQAGAIQTQTQAKLQARRSAVGEQLRSLGPPPLPANLPTGTRAKLEQIHAEFASRFQADAQKTIAEYNDTKADLDR